MRCVIRDERKKLKKMEDKGRKEQINGETEDRTEKQWKKKKET